MRYDELGDFLLWLPAARRLRKALPETEWEIKVAVKPLVSELSGICGYWDGSFGISPCLRMENLAALCKLVAELSKADALLNPMPDLSRAYFAIFSAAQTRLCLDTGEEGFVWRSGKEIEWHNSLYTGLVKASKGEHMLDINDRLVNAVVGPEAEGSSTLEGALDFIPDEKPGISNYLLVAPGGGDPRKRWESFKFAAFANAVADNFDKIVVCGTEAEASLATAMRQEPKASGKLVELCGKTSFIELSGLVKHARLFIGNDSSASHLAAFHGTPAICVLGAGHYGSFHPYPDRFNGKVKEICLTGKRSCGFCNWSCERQTAAGEPFPCVTEVGVEEAVAAAKRLLPSLH